MTTSAVCHLRGISPYSQSRMHFAPSKQKEGGDAYEERTWREKCHVVSETDPRIIIPRDQFRLALADAAEYQSERIKGKGMATYTKHFGAGVQVNNDLVTEYTKENVPLFRGPMHADGKRNSGSRVPRNYPLIPTWKGKVEFLILDPIITPGAFEAHLKVAGLFIGIGRWRPRNRGQNGRFTCDKIEWKEVNL